MADTNKVLGQSAPLATTLTDLYTVPAATQTVVSSIVCCNRDSVAIKFRISVAIAGAADAVAQYLYWDVNLNVGDTYVAVLGITLAATDKIRVRSTTANTSFSAFGVEIT